MANPYAGQEYYEEAWAQGYEYGQNNPGDEEPTPPDFSSWGLDEETAGYVAQVWQEGALAGRESAQAPQQGYDPDTDTFVGSSDEFPALALAAQYPDDFDGWLTAIGIDPAIFTDDNV